MQPPNNRWNSFKRVPRWVWIGIALVAGAVAWGVWFRGGTDAGEVPTFAARRGPLDITVLEGGSLQALEFQEIKCEVRVGYQGTKILKIVEEGYLVTEDDVKTNKVLVELDSSELQKQIVQQEIQYQSAVASLIDAQQNYEIQLNQNASDIQAAEQKVRFARMDFDKYLGDTVTEQIIREVGLDAMLARASTNVVEEGVLDEPPPRRSPGAGPTNAAPVIAPAVVRFGDGPVEVATAGMTAASGPVPAGLPKTGPGAGSAPAAAKATSEAPSEAGTNRIAFDFSGYAQIEQLGDGEAKQKLRKAEDDLQVAQKELGQAKSTLDGTKRLFEKGFVTRTELEREEIAYENNRLKVQTAETARDLLRKYDFLKLAEESLSKYADAVREFDKARRVAISKLAQARAKLKSAQGQYQVQARQREDYQEQLRSCTIHATKPGLVVYGGGRDENFYFGGEERIREGATVRERQAIITIPNLSKMSVNVKIHESYIKKIKKGQKARITADAFPDTVLTGEVSKVGVLPDSQNRWMNPDLKVYLTTITIDSSPDWVKPGMSAKVEVLVDKLADCVYVPVQAVSADGDRQVCYLANGSSPERREVEIGQFNDEFIEIKSGLREGERVLLKTPGGAEKGGAPEDKPKNGKKPEEQDGGGSAPGQIAVKKA